MRGGNETRPIRRRRLVTGPGAVALVVVLSGFVVSGLATGCSSSTKTPATTTGPPSTTRSASAAAGKATTGLLGTYNARFTGNEELDGHPVQVMAGTEETANLTITPDEIRVSTQNGTNFFDLGPSFTYTSDHLTIKGDPACDNLVGPVADGTYSFTIDGPMLTFHEVSDTCIDRAGVLTSHPWRRST